MDAEHNQHTMTAVILIAVTLLFVVLVFLGVMHLNRKMSCGAALAPAGATTYDPVAAAKCRARGCELDSRGMCAGINGRACQGLEAPAAMSLEACLKTEGCTWDDRLNACRCGGGRTAFHIGAVAEGHEAEGGAAERIVDGHPLMIHTRIQ